MILLIDNYDSFVYNLYQYLGHFTDEIHVVRNDQITIEEIEALNPDGIVISPGPKAPKDAGICVDAIRSFYKTIPILGVCLGHQCIGAAFGARIGYAKELVHGRADAIYHDEAGIFEGIETPTKVARYHSLAIDRDTLPGELLITAETDDGEIMAVRHERYPLTGVQFHPESIITDAGMALIQNFLKGVDQ
jgi:anthranilate synthase component 2